MATNKTYIVDETNYSYHKFFAPKNYFPEKVKDIDR